MWLLERWKNELKRRRNDWQTTKTGFFCSGSQRSNITNYEMKEFFFLRMAQQWRQNLVKETFQFFMLLICKFHLFISRRPSLMMCLLCYCRNTGDGIHSCSGISNNSQLHRKSMSWWTIGIMWVFPFCKTRSITRRLDLGRLWWWSWIWLQVSDEMSCLHNSLCCVLNAEHARVFLTLY